MSDVVETPTESDKNNTVELRQDGYHLVARHDRWQVDDDGLRSIICANALEEAAHFTCGAHQFGGMRCRRFTGEHRDMMGLVVCSSRPVTSQFLLRARQSGPCQYSARGSLRLAAAAGLNRSAMQN